MPYRKLPKTDQARLRTLQKAVDRNVQNGIFMNVLSHNTYHKTKNLLYNFSREVSAYKKCQSEQSAKRNNEKYETALKRARMYISHFIQVLSLSIVRGEIARGKRHYYGLPTDEDTVPNLSSEAAVLEWGRLVIEGERHRQAEGGVPIYNPTMARVSVEYELFKEQYEHRLQLQQQTTEVLAKISTMRPMCDEIILTVWAEIENSFQALPQDEKLKKCSEYGVIYYTRKDRCKKNDD